MPKTNLNRTSVHSGRKCLMGLMSRAVVWPNTAKNNRSKAKNGVMGPWFCTVYNCVWKIVRSHEYSEEDNRRCYRKGGGKFVRIIVNWHFVVDLIKKHHFVLYLWLCILFRLRFMCSFECVESVISRKLYFILIVLISIMIIDYLVNTHTQSK